jgi:hypothetical protein
MFFKSKIEKNLISLSESFKDFFNVGTTISPWTLKFNKIEKILYLPIAIFNFLL